MINLVKSMKYIIINNTADYKISDNISNLRKISQNKK